MRLIRPFDYDSDLLAIIENPDWKFEVVVAPLDENQKLFEIVRLDVPLTEEQTRLNATVIINELYLLQILKKVMEDTKTYESMRDESAEYTFGPEEATAEQVYKAKRRAVSIALEEIIDYVEAYVFDNDYSEDDND
jgi:hypothetical protein